MTTSVERFEDAHTSYDSETFVLREPSRSPLVDQRQASG